MRARHEESMTTVLRELHLEPQTGAGLIVKRGQRLQIVDPCGEQVSDLVSFSEHDRNEWLSSGRTIDYANTIYLTTADGEGNMVSLIQSNYRGMGCGIAVPGLGFGFQDRGEMFVLDPSHANVYAPGKRPFHTIIPAFITKDGKPWISFGVMGGQMQPQGHVQIVMNLIDFGMGLQEAGDAPRLQHNGSSEVTGTKMADGGQVAVEFGFPSETERDLVKLGHKVGRDKAGTFGGYQAIFWDATNKVYWGASESRKDGQAAPIQGSRRPYLHSRRSWADGIVTTMANSRARRFPTRSSRATGAPWTWIMTGIWIRAIGAYIVHAAACRTR
jgi:hypothetical protein